MRCKITSTGKAKTPQNRVTQGKDGNGHQELKTEQTAESRQLLTHSL